eukprot:scaffold296398_cov17-Prasinocladus_malaysianus.AAC.1
MGALLMNVDCENTINLRDRFAMKAMDLATMLPARQLPETSTYFCLSRALSQLQLDMLSS